MTLQNGLFTLALSALLLAPAARADDFRGGQHDASPVGGNVYDSRGHTGGGYHPAPTPPPPAPPRSRGPRHEGRYELRTVQKWVPGHYEQVWVEQDCRYKSRHHRVRCQDGHYEQRWVEGYYQPVQEWVWVPARPGPYAVASTRW